MSKQPDLDREFLQSVYLAFLAQEEYEVVDIILFGSRARGDFDEGSDYDLAILVKDCDRAIEKYFSKRSWNELGGYPTDILYISPERFEAEHFGVWGRIKKEGVSIIDLARGAFW